MPHAPEGTLIEALKARIPHIDAHLHGPQPAPNTPLSSAHLVAVEDTLGFPIPPLLARIYQEAGNGGFGPGYGLMGLGEDGFQDDLGRSADKLYQDFTEVVPGQRSHGWPKNLLPLCTYGCAIYHCVDATTEEIIVWDPNWLQNDRQPARAALFPTGLSLTDWFQRWSIGDNPFDNGLIGTGFTPEIPSLYDLEPQKPRAKPRDKNQLDFLDKL